MLIISMYQSGVDFNCPSIKPSVKVKALNRLNAIFVNVVHRIAKSPCLLNWYMSSAIDL